MPVNCQHSHIKLVLAVEHFNAANNELTVLEVTRHPISQP